MIGARFRGQRPFQLTAPEEARRSHRGAARLPLQPTRTDPKKSCGRAWSFMSGLKLRQLSCTTSSIRTMNCTSTSTSIPYKYCTKINTHSTRIPAGDVQSKLKLTVDHSSPQTQSWVSHMHYLPTILPYRTRVFLSILIAQDFKTAGALSFNKSRRLCHTMGERYSVIFNGKRIMCSTSRRHRLVPSLLQTQGSTRVTDRRHQTQRVSRCRRASNAMLQSDNARTVFLFMASVCWFFSPSDPSWKW